MGWLAFAVSNVVFTTLTMGLLKKEGVLQLHTEKLSNTTLRMVIEGAVDGGEVVIVSAENFWHELTKILQSSKKGIYTPKLQKSDELAGSIWGELVETAR